MVEIIIRSLIVFAATSGLFYCRALKPAKILEGNSSHQLKRVLFMVGSIALLLTNGIRYFHNLRTTEEFLSAYVVALLLTGFVLFRGFRKLSLVMSIQLFSIIGLASVA